MKVIVIFTIELLQNMKVIKHLLGMTVIISAGQKKQEQAAVLLLQIMKIRELYNLC